jgi:hypothetical protein
MSSYHSGLSRRRSSVLSYSPPLLSHMVQHPRHIQEAQITIQEDRAIAEQMLMQRARHDPRFAYKIRVDPAYYAGKLRQQMYAVERERLERERQLLVRLPLSMSILQYLTPTQTSPRTVKFAPSVMPASRVTYR